MCGAPSAARRAVPGRTLAEVERDYIIATLEQNGGNQTRTAQVLQIGIATLYRKLKSYGLITNPRIAVFPVEPLSLVGAPRRPPLPDHDGPPVAEPLFLQRATAAP